jgi:hypothetical protein
MANTAQCYYCFESLLASFEDREPATLAAVEALWEQHEQTKKLSSLQDQTEQDADRQQSVNEEDEDDSRESSLTSSRPNKLKLPGVSRLQSYIQCSHYTIVYFKYVRQFTWIQLHQHHLTRAGRDPIPADIARSAIPPVRHMEHPVTKWTQVSAGLHRHIRGTGTGSRAEVLRFDLVCTSQSLFLYASNHTTPVQQTSLYVTFFSLQGV